MTGLRGDLTTPTAGVGVTGVFGVGAFIDESSKPQQLIVIWNNNNANFSIECQFYFLDNTHNKDWIPWAILTIFVTSSTITFILLNMHEGTSTLPYYEVDTYGVSIVDGYR